MPSFSTEALTDDDLTAILGWLREAQKPVDGEGLFHRFCANCHGADGLGGRVDKNIVKEADEGADELLEAVREGHGGESYGSAHKYMPAWPDKELTGTEVSAIADYLSTLPGGHGGGGDGDGDGDGDD